MLITKAVLLLALLCVNISFGHTTQRPSRSASDDEDSNPLFDMASMFIQEAMNNQNNGARGGGGGGAGLAGVASLIGSFMQANAGGGQGKNAGSGAMQILSGIGSLLANAGNNNGGRSGGGFDPSIIGNVIEMFTQGDDGDDEGADEHPHQKRESESSGIDLGSILQIASAFMGQNNEQPSQRSHHHQQKRSTEGTTQTGQQEENGFMSLLPLIMQAVSSFAGPEGQHTQEKHKDHAWVLPPFLEHLHVLWDHFSNSELADALYEKSGINKILKVIMQQQLKCSIIFQITVYYYYYFFNRASRAVMVKWTTINSLSR